MRAAACLGAGTLLAGTVGLLTAGPAQASFISQGLASAEGVHTTVHSDMFPLFSTPVDASMPLADVAVDARGNSLAQAADPYPGDTISQGVPGLIATEGLAPPTVPANELSQYPTTPSSHLDAMVYQLFADSAQYTSTATATTGASAAAAGAAAVTDAATAAVTVSPTTGEVDASATSAAAPLNVGILSMGAVMSHATIKRLPGAAPTRDVGIDVGQTTVMGMSVDITPAGLTVPGVGTTALPNEAAMLNSALAAAGITITYLSQIDSADGSVAPGIEIDQTMTSSTGQVTSTMTIEGQASASATTSASKVVARPTTKASATPSATPSKAPASVTPKPSVKAGPTKEPSTPAKPTSAPAATTPAPAAPPTTSPAAVLPVATPAATSGGGTVSAIVPAVTGANGAITAPPDSTTPVELAASSAPDAATGTGTTAPVDTSAAAPEAVQPQTMAPDTSLAAARRSDGSGASASSFYLVLVAGGIVLLASSASVRALGVRLLWTR